MFCCHALSKLLNEERILRFHKAIVMPNINYFHHGTKVMKSSADEGCESTGISAESRTVLLGGLDGLVATGISGTKFAAQEKNHGIRSSQQHFGGLRRE
jgi:hypothetical protein